VHACAERVSDQIVQLLNGSMVRDRATGLRREARAADVAILFRTLDAFRIYDVVYIMTNGANKTESVSLLGYRVLINRLNLGLGSAISVLIFFCVILIALIFTRFLGASPQRR